MCSMYSILCHYNASENTISELCAQISVKLSNSASSKNPQLPSTRGKQYYQTSLWSYSMYQQTYLFGCVWYIGRDKQSSKRLGWLSESYNGNVSKYCCVCITVSLLKEMRKQRYWYNYPSTEEEIWCGRSRPFIVKKCSVDTGRYFDIYISNSLATQT